MVTRTTQVGPDENLMCSRRSCARNIPPNHDSLQFGSKTWWCVGKVLETFTSTAVMSPDRSTLAASMSKISTSTIGAGTDWKGPWQFQRSIARAMEGWWLPARARSPRIIKVYWVYTVRVVDLGQQPTSRFEHIMMTAHCNRQGSSTASATSPRTYPRTRGSPPSPKIPWRTPGYSSTRQPAQQSNIMHIS
jgi:hypothetical protein